ncbi:hypothetical protein [Cupriavidus alkaliphilus]|uniref:hypothetical protein n=1 Tax=Cupriavidus alkaliphilus TaxID=942866 RepID=UPI0016074D9F|nr:hypothetical protein [Cupriavidus alkaliphilus]MBB2918285.1 hypothetical protein [Cupriavidus alkaliphilus]
MSTYVERALFIVAPRNFGKSTVLRSMFQDPRFGTNGDIPTASNLSDVFRLGKDRRLYLRLMSPHESGESLTDFIGKTKGKMTGGRWCFAGPLHPGAYKEMPDAVTTIGRFIKTFDPERVRVVLLWPSHHEDENEEFGADTVENLLEELQEVDGRVEVLCVDGRKRGRSGLLLADYFDFA